MGVLLNSLPSYLYGRKLIEFRSCLNKMTYLFYLISSVMIFNSSFDLIYIRMSIFRISLIILRISLEISYSIMNFLIFVVFLWSLILLYIKNMSDNSAQLDSGKIIWLKIYRSLLIIVLGSNLIVFDKLSGIFEW